MTPACIIGISGYSRSGKTTLIEKALSELKRDGLYVGILKHTTHHSLSLDMEGKDTDRFYKVGADFVFAHDTVQGFARYPHKDAGLHDALKHFPSGLDLIIVEGHKDSMIPRIWLELKASGDLQVRGQKDVIAVLFRDDEHYIEKFLGFIHEELEKCRLNRPVRAGLLVGGKSSRMGRSKALLEIGGKTLIERSFDTLSRITESATVLGSTVLPVSLRNAERLPDVPGIWGPMAGMLSAFRWVPESAWLMSAVDMPFMDDEAWNWLLGQRRPGVWAVLPRLQQGAAAETAGACYEPMIFEYVESLAFKGILKLQMIARHPKVITPIIPESLRYAWKNINTPEEWKEVLKE
jgi:molybdenum cofactor guanylyltransferase